MDDIVGILIILLLILLTAFFVAAEFAIVKVRLTRLEEMASEGNKRAKAAKKITEHLDAYLSTTQLGITITALIIGWVGEPAFSKLFDPALGMIGIDRSINESISAVISFIIITYINVVFGELAPKSIAIQQAEKITLLIAYPLIWFNRLMFPFIWLLNKTSNSITRLFGISPDANKEAALSEEELKLILSNSYKGGEINQLELQYLNRIFDFDERTSREIMVPRTEIVCLYKDHSLEENLEILRQEKFTRFPVVDGDKDTILGMINIKDLFDDYLIGNIQPLDQYIRPIISVIETTPIRELLTKMQRLGIHMAMLTDEYGGTAGLVTVEDIIEEIVGDIRDEFDEHEEPMVQYATPNHLIVDGKVLISEINHILDLDINNDDLDTIGGWLLSKNNDAKVGNIIYLGDYAFVVQEVDHHHIKKITIRPKQALKAQ
ncbi:hemolysin family protein [Terrilactibacillus laevilacticus]|uniref:Hemolysin family protein n=1 Tax=Terrilactibacillus laevilacticus TaxID=1380157 RepID=A0ABW5PQD0_9BACI|nr:hemolysin family protein [Terrilactibacillus laevilacticus]